MYTQTQSQTQSKTVLQTQPQLSIQSQNKTTEVQLQTQSQTIPPLDTKQNQSTTGTNGRKKVSRTKEAKRTLRLKLTERTSDIVSCALHTIPGQVINFKFSMAYDKPREIFQNMVRYLMSVCLSVCVCVCLSVSVLSVCVSVCLSFCVCYNS